MELKNTNIYTIAFPFKGEYHYPKFDANQISMMLFLGICGDALADHLTDVDGWMSYRFSVDTKKYLATFGIDNVLSISVYEYHGDPDNNDYDETLVEDKIPYHIIKIDNGTETTFNISDNV